MKELCLGELVRRRRGELNISQEALCEGLCSVTALSRFENGRHDLSFKRVSALMERLGLSHERYSVLLTEGEEALETAEREVRSASVWVAKAAAEERPTVWVQFQEKLTALEALGPDDPFVRQCVLSLRAVMGDENGPYPLEKRLSMLLEAIRLTIPRFDPGHTGLGPYSAEELRLIYQLAGTYARAEAYEEAARVYRAVMEYLEANGLRLRQYSILLSIIANGYSWTLCRMGRWQESLDIAERGVRACLESARCSTLAQLLTSQGECLFRLGEQERGIDLFRQAYYVLRATRDESSIRDMMKQLNERLTLKDVP